MFLKKIKKNRGFTLIELIVAISVFTFIMFISTGSILSIIDANRKSQSLRAVMDNLNYTLESMTRTIRFGTNYHCDITQGTVSNPSDCPVGTGANSLAVLGPGGVQVRYRYDAANSAIERSTDNGATYIDLTSANVTITSINFRVYGSASYTTEGAGAHYQPQVIIVISGYSGAKPTSRTSFTLQTTVSQRIIDSQ